LYWGFNIARFPKEISHHFLGKLGWSIKLPFFLWRGYKNAQGLEYAIPKLNWENNPLQATEVEFYWDFDFMKLHIVSILLLLLPISLLAHDGGHGQAQLWLVNNQPVLAEFIKYENHQVHLLNPTGELITHAFSQFSPKHQEHIQALHEQTVYVNRGVKVDRPLIMVNPTRLAFFLSASLLLLALVTLLRQQRQPYLALGLGLASLLAFVTACDPMEELEPGHSDEVPANDPDFLSDLANNFANVSVAADAEWIYFTSNGLAEHSMMVGITNWQQQVPIDQDFAEDNRFQIPLQPVVASEVTPVENEFFRNATGIAVNGVPLYHPMTNAGVDALASGQLDQWGGHSGRADDYHYHIPPTHLEAIIGTGNPVAYALDGFPIYGETTEPLDANLGRYNDEGGYQYHTVSEYPYFMANLVGEVTLTETADGNNTVYEIIPQPRTVGARPSTDPLGGQLVITGFESTGPNAYMLTYSLDRSLYFVRYSWDASGMYTYEFEDPNGNVVRETYQRD